MHTNIASCLSVACLQVEVYRPVDPLASLWIVRMPEDDEQQDHEVRVSSWSLT